MSRLTSMSPEALRAVFSPEMDADLITLITISDYDDSGTVIRISDGYTQRLTGTDPFGNPLTDDTQVIYGVECRGEKFIFLPVSITLPSEEEASTPRCSLTITDVTQYLIPVIRGTILRPPKLKMELVLSNDPDLNSPSYVPEISFSQFYINSITYNADTVQCDISMISYQSEPFPCFSFTPKYFPGIF